MKILCLQLGFVSLFASSEYFYSGGKKVPLTPLLTNNYSLKNQNNLNETIYYKTHNDIKLGVRDEIIIKIHKDSNIASILEKYDLTLIKSFSNNLYLIQVKNSNDTLDISNKLYLESSVVYAHPNFIKEIIKR